jgi:hypothetical protein
MIHTLFLEFMSIFNESFQDLQHFTGIVESSGVNQGICCIKRSLGDRWVSVCASDDDEEIQKLLNAGMWDEFACSLDDLWQGNPVEASISFKVIVISSLFQRFKVQLLDNHDFRVIKLE